ncbi:MAG: cysteine hydrolase [Marinosulfonomonas sp.]|nr:cysteine hydrolase [Marinosulfonomonas sp.]
MTTTALLIVDMQNDYFDGGKFPLAGTDAAAGNAATILAAFRTAGRPVIHIRHEIHRKPAPFFEPGTTGAEIHASVAPIKDEAVITKIFPNSFRKTDLQDQLQALGVTNLVIIGAMSHFCIDATTRAAADLGYACTVAHDACATRDLEFDGVSVPAAQVHAGFMAALAMGYGAILPTDQVIAGLSD